MGKSSLRVQTMRRLQEEGVACGAIDLTAIGSQDITAQQWYAGIFYSLASGFELLDKFDLLGWWGDRSFLSPIQRLSQFIDEVLLVEVTENISIFIDEIDSILSLGFNGDDFFGLIRACYNKRSDSEKYRRLSFALLGVATPSDLIRNRNVSTPFNIGKAIELQGFKLEEAMPLARGFEGVFPEAIAVLKEVLDWTGGQPFLTQKVCLLALETAGKEEVENIGEWVAGVVRSRVIENWEGQDEPEHLKTIRDRLLYSCHHQQDLLLSYRRILREGEIRVSNKPEEMELRLTGLVVRRGGKLRVYNRIYAAVFNLSWVEGELGEMGLLPEVEETKAAYFRKETGAIAVSHKKDDRRPTKQIQQRLITTISSNPEDRFFSELSTNDKLIRVYRGDIVDLIVDAIVSSDDTRLKMGGGVSRKIREVGGEEIYYRVQKLAPIGLGQVAVTSAGNLLAKKVFHPAVIDWSKKNLSSADVIKQAVCNCMTGARQYNFKSIAFPLMATGAGMLQPKVVWKAMLSQLKVELSKEEQTVREVAICIYGIAAQLLVE
jgi:O-acetyl-ADP-ribose deacetylase (regulator of RNase III)